MVTCGHNTEKPLVKILMLSVPDLVYAFCSQCCSWEKSHRDRHYDCIFYVYTLHSIPVRGGLTRASCGYVNPQSHARGCRFTARSDLARNAFCVMVTIRCWWRSV